MAERGSAGWLESDGFTTLDASELARLVDRTSERELRHRLIGGVREVALREIFRRMPEYLRPARAAGFDAVVAWRITGAGGHGRPGDLNEHWIRIRGLSVPGDLALASRLTKIFAVGPAWADRRRRRSVPRVHAIGDPVAVDLTAPVRRTGA